MPFPKITAPDGREIKRGKFTANKPKKLQAAHGYKWESWPLNNARQREHDITLKEAHEARLALMRAGRPALVKDEAGVRRNRHSKRYEEERRRAEDLAARRMWEDEDGRSDAEDEPEEKQGVLSWEEPEDKLDEEGMGIEHLVKVRVVKARRQRDQKQFEMLSPVRNVVALDEDDFGGPSSRAPLPLDFDIHSDLDEWEEVDSSDADDSDDAFREHKDDIGLEAARGPSYAHVVASVPSERQAWLVENL